MNLTHVMIMPCVFLLLILSIDRYYNGLIPPILLATLYHTKLQFIPHLVALSVSGDLVICTGNRSGWHFLGHS